MTTLSTDELARIKFELGANVLSGASSPYVFYYSIFEGIIKETVVSSDTAPTSSSTTVSQATIDAGGATTITVASVTGLSVGTKIQLDVDGARETVTIRNISSLTLSVICRKPHSGTYPVEIESPLTLVRGILADLSGLEHNNVMDAISQAGLKRVDEVEFTEQGISEALEKRRFLLRTQLAKALGISELYANLLLNQNGSVVLY